MVSILIADDSAAIRLVLKDVLELGQHSFAGEAADGQEAIEKYAELKPELLLLDLAMPKKDGLSVVKEIIKSYPNANIILITAADDQKVINQCLTAGAKAYISKPFDFDNVLKIISSVTSK
jgi:two-component system chemotaxis response regulator CheY